MRPSRRDFLGAATCAVLGARLRAADEAKPDLHEQLLERAARLQATRRARFAAVKNQADLDGLQTSLRQAFLDLLDGLPERAGPPPAKIVGRIDADDYTIDKLVYESFPGYFVSALLYRPKRAMGKAPGILSPCGHSTVGKAADSYQILHVNLARRGHVVLTYDPVGQAERSQFWDSDRKRSRFNLTCGEHAVLGNPLYLLGTSLARYRIHDGLCGLDYLASLDFVDAKKLGCVGNSGGGTLTAYIAALEPRVAACAISCYITTLPHRMGNRIDADPDSDPEQDVFDFVGRGIDHAGLLALLPPRAGLVNSAQLDFFPIEGARQSVNEAKHLYEAIAMGERVKQAESPGKHGLAIQLRQAAYGWFDRWLLGKKDANEEETPVKLRKPDELLVCPAGQVNVSFRSKHLLTLAGEHFNRRAPEKKPALRDLLRIDEQGIDIRVSDASQKRRDDKGPIFLCVNGNEAPSWAEDKGFVAALAKQAGRVLIVEPRGVGALKAKKWAARNDYMNPLHGAEANLAYNAFLIGKTLLGMRVADVLSACQKLPKERVVLVGRKDAGLVCLFAAALEPAIRRVAVEETIASYEPFFDPAGKPINAASLVPGLLRDFGDVREVAASLAPRKLLLSAPDGEMKDPPKNASVASEAFSKQPELLLRFVMA